MSTILPKKSMTEEDIKLQYITPAIITKRKRKLFITFFAYFYSFPLHHNSFSALYKGTLSVVSTSVCGWLCGQSEIDGLPSNVIAVGR